MFRELSSKNDPFQADLFSVTGNMKIIEGSDTPYMLDQKSAAGVPRLLQYERLKNEIANITSKRSNSIYAETQSDAIRTAIDQTEELGGLMSDVTLATSFGNHKVSRQFKQIAKVIKLRTKLKQERGGFVVGSTGWDTHGNFDDVVGPLFESINNGLDEFQQEMKAQGAWDDVIVLVISDFARTITSNGKGTDHGWGGNYFIAGGKVNGGKIFGKYPEALGQTPNSLINKGRGILIPTSPWDAVWAGIAEWMGVPANKMDTVLPNVANFPESTILRKAELFK
jgi:cullin-associated NEDD8-dissociated protein 1